MKRSLSEISTVGASFADDVAAYAAAGFDAIGIWEMKLPPDDDANRALLREHGLIVANCVPAVPSFLPLDIPGLEGPSGPAERLDALTASVRRLAQYEPEAIVCLTGPVGSYDETAARTIVVDGLSALAAVARAIGARLAFEPIHRAQRETTSFVNTIADAIALLAEAGADDVGLLLDLYHVWDDPDIWRTIELETARIAGVHVADWPLDEARTDRELPGLGRSQTKELLAALARAGFAGSLDVEIFGTDDGFWGLPVDVAAREAFTALADVTTA